MTERQVHFRSIRIMFCAFPIWLFVLQIASGSVEIPWQIELSKPGDRATVTTQEKVMTVTLISATGIGGAKLRRPDTLWPSELRLRLQLKELEGLEMRNGVIHFSTFRKNKEKVSYWKAGESESKGHPPAGEFEVEIGQGEGWVEIVVPAKMLEKKAREIEFHWVDYYR